MSKKNVQLLPDLLRKARAIMDFSRFAAVDLVSLIKINFEGKFFYDSEIEKSEFFLHLLEGKIDRSTEYFLERKCNLPYHRDSRQSISYKI
jgi:hypothetical protein